MTILSLVSGIVHRAPKSGLSKGGKNYTSLDLKFADGSATVFVRVTAFLPDIAAELESFKVGDPIAVTGRLQAQLFEPDNAPPRVSISLIVDRVMGIKKPPRRKPTDKSADQPPSRSPAASHGRR